MNPKDDSLVLKLLKKSVGLPTGSSKCGCGTASAQEASQPQPSETTSTDCDCAASPEEQKPPAQA